MKRLRLTLCIATFFLPMAGCSHAEDEHASHAVGKKEKSSVQLTLLPQAEISQEKSVEILAKLLDLNSHTIITDDQLAIVHTQKFHLLVIDPTLTDYQHIHPQVTDTAGVYRFNFTPKLARGYRAWADVTPAGGTQQFAMADLNHPRLSAITKTEMREVTQNGYRFTLSFDTQPRVGAASMGTIHIIDSKGNAVTALEPVMGAFAHIVAFSEDVRTVIHTHPMGKEPQSASERGGPDLMFHLEPKKPGFIKLFAQVKIGGKDMFVPFGINVEP